MRKGAIMLIPKLDQRDRMKDWRPISLLGITYKIISKLLVERLKPLLPQLINPQQTGFVHGRSIFDVILAVKLGQEWAKLLGQQSVLLKLDFVKAYDMGCRIAPLLFALSTQPLMAMLNSAQVEGRLQGLEVVNGRQILDAFFADDTRIKRIGRVQQQAFSILN
ncbi:hypothetical protein R1sor_011706 [Riccia sorocarpa]|uniref:Reverse transcriptase domain-containing protein n=1 Tax=Riccia sorocarpa TaxID=122646 RepID=A0ABD3I5A8_9MARC